MVSAFLPPCIKEQKEMRNMNNSELHSAIVKASGLDPKALGEHLIVASPPAPQGPCAVLDCPCGHSFYPRETDIMRNEAHNIIWTCPACGRVNNEGANA